MNKNHHALTQLECQAVSDVLFVDTYMLRDVYHNYGIDGIGVIALNNMFFIMNDNVVGDINDLHHMARMFADNKGDDIVKFLFNKRLYIKYNNFYYSEKQLTLMGYDCGKLKYAEDKYLKCSVNGTLKYPNLNRFNRAYIEKGFYRLINLVNMKLPDHILKKLNTMHKFISGINVRKCLTLINLYLVLDPSFIGFKKSIEIELHVARKNVKGLLELLNKARVFVYDESQGVIYDPVQRKFRGLPAVPGKDEINMAFERRKFRIFNIFNNI